MPRAGSGETAARVPSEHLFGREGLPVGVRTTEPTRDRAPDPGRGAVRVLGIDPGLTRCGLGVVDGQRPLRLVEVGVVRTDASADLADRLLAIDQEIDRWITAHSPDVVAVERVFAQHNVRTVMGTAQASGIAVLAAARHGIPVVLHTPSEVKAAVTGSGRADKAQVGAMVQRLLSLSEVPRPADAADALALAVCHQLRGSAFDRIRRAMAGRAS